MADNNPDDQKVLSPAHGPARVAGMQQGEYSDPRLIPGGRHGAVAEIGMSAMDRSEVPSEAQKPEQASYGDSPQGAE